MKANQCLALLVSCIGTAGIAHGVPNSFITVNVSVKLIVNPMTGNPPATFDDAILYNSFELMNRWLANTWRGYRVKLVDLGPNNTFKRIGYPVTVGGPTEWYGTDLKNNETANHTFETIAKGNATYSWNTAALNLYINNGDWSAAQFPSTGWELVISGYGLVANNDAPDLYQTNNYKIAGNLLHEIGHFFELYHTFSELDMADLARDLPEATGRNETAIHNAISQFNWSVDYDALTSESRKKRVRNTANNAMSYYQLFYDDPAQMKVLTDAERFGPARFVFTELQMDRWSDYANNQRASTVTGRMRFVYLNAISDGTGTSTSPFKALSSAINAASASGNDILILRPGTYTAATLTKPMTLRATRDAPATIVKP